MSHGLTTDAPIDRQLLHDLAAGDGAVHVIGAASAEGVAVTRLLTSLGIVVVLHDMRERGAIRKAFRTTHGAYSLAQQDAIWAEIAPILDSGCTGDSYLTGIEDAAAVSLGQGWYLDQENRERIAHSVPSGVPILSMTGLYFALSAAPIAGITGTNGKSTTVALVDALLEGGGVSHRTAGNERSMPQVLPEIESLTKDDWLVLEVSNRQLLQLSRSPRIAAITALTPDHLEEHGGIDGYVAAKRRLFAAQGASDIAIANASDALALEVARSSSGLVIQCGVGSFDGPAVTWIDDTLVATDVPVVGGPALSGRTELAHMSDLTLPGRHNQINAAVAVATALSCGTPPASIAASLAGFSGKSLRLEQLDSVNDIEIWSDIKSTTPEATVAALQALDSRSLHLIIGGTDKGLNYSGLARTIVEQRVAVLAVPGSATDALEQELHSADPHHTWLERVDSLETALDEALGNASAGDAIIVSPAAAGFWTTQLQGKPSLRALVRRRRESDITRTSERATTHPGS